MSIPTISVICAVYNGEKFLHEAIQSILEQTFEDFEFILVDDGSSDGSPDILHKFATEDARVRVVLQENAGLTQTLNTALKQARGRYIARQDDDDISHPSRLELQQRYLNDHPACAVVGARYQSIDESGIVIGRSNVPTGSDPIKRSLLTHNVIAHSAAMFRRREILDLGGYDVSFRYAQDYELWCRVALHHDLANLRDCLLSRRKHASQIGARQKSGQQEAGDRIRQAYRRAVLKQEGTCRFPWWMKQCARLYNLFG